MMFKLNHRLQVKRETLQESVIYHIDNFYNPKYEKVIKYNDKKFKIKWPIPIKTVSKKDA